MKLQLRPGTPAAPEGILLPLLPSGPDGVRGPSPRRTQPSTPRLHDRLGSLGPRAGIRPRWSGLRVQGTASSPSSTASIEILSYQAIRVKQNPELRSAQAAWPANRRCLARASGGAVPLERLFGAGGVASGQTKRLAGSQRSAEPWLILRLGRRKSFWGQRRGGEGGIRTREGLLLTRFPIARVRPAALPLRVGVIIPASGDPWQPMRPRLPGTTGARAFTRTYVRVSGMAPSPRTAT